MSYVVYDVETTGLRKGFDQILQFAAVRLDADFQVLDQFETGCRLMPHIVPAPGALHVTGVDIRDITRPDLRSHYEMVCAIEARLRRWGPAIFLGFNSIRFDEEFLRQAFYQCLHPAYLTNTGGSARADVLNLARVVAALRPDVLRAPRGPDGRPVFRLGDLARENGIAAPRAHVASADVEVTAALCRQLHAGAPDLWSRFVQFAQKSVVDAFVRDEDAFLLFQAFGDHHQERVLTRIGEHEEQTNRQYCLDLTHDPDALAALSDEALTEAFRSRQGPLVTVRTNAAPLLCPIDDAPDEALPGLDPGEAADRVVRLRAWPGLVRRLEAAARRAERVYDPSRHVEQQLYGHPFPTPHDAGLMALFHAADWPERLQLAGRFEDVRYRNLARRIVFCDRPDVFGAEARARFEAGVRRRLADEAADCPWLTVPAARADLDALLEACDEDARPRLTAYRDHLAALG